MLNRQDEELCIARPDNLRSILLPSAQEVFTSRGSNKQVRCPVSYSVKEMLE